MGIKNKPFVRYNEDKIRDSFTVNLNKEERALLEKGKDLIEQIKDSTALKLLFIIGTNHILREKSFQILKANRRKNKRLGIADFD